MKANKFTVTGLTDAGKIPDIKNSIHSHTGVNAVRVDMNASTVTVDFDEAKCSDADVQSFVSQTGLNVTNLVDTRTKRGGLI